MKLTLRLLPISVISITAATFLLSNRAQAQCPGLGSISLNIVAAPEPTITGSPQFCSGGNTTLTVPGSFNSYAWSAGGNGASITVSAPGTYTVTVSNASGCTGTASQTVTVNPNPVAAVTIQGTNQCGGSFTLTAAPGFSSYAWSTGETTSVITVSQNGTYVLTVTDANGCTDDVTNSFTFEDSLNVAITGNTQICTGESTTLSATAGFNAYTWSNGDTGPSINLNAGGVYTVTVTGNANCIGIESVTVTEFPNPAPAFSGPGQICSGQNATISVNGTYSIYQWSTGANTPSITTGSPGTYSVTVTTANGCTNTGSFTLAVDPSPNPQISAAPYQCDGQLTLDAGGGLNSYAWSDGQSGNPITVFTSGNYTVTVTAANGCTATDNFFANIPASPLVDITGESQYCEGESVLLQATPGFLSYVWSNGQNGPSISVSNPGAYSVTATDNFGCTDTGSIAIDELLAPAPTINGPAVICAGESATLTVPGAFSSYAWSTGANTQSISVSNSGNYTVTVTDFNGCTGTDNFSLMVNSSPSPNITAAPYACNGQLTLNAGAGFSAYAWSTGGNGQTIAVVNPGIYAVTVTNANGCTGTDSFAADIPSPPVVGISGDNQICQGQTATLTATPGFAAYVWSNSTFNNFIQVGQTGTYSVTVTDNFGCTATDAFALSVLNNPNPVIAGPSSICAGGTATFSVSGNFAGYSWSTGGTGSSIAVSAAGTYSVTVTAANGCTGADDVTLGISNNLQPQIVQQAYQCDGQITLDAGAGFTTYTWSTGGNSQTITVNSSDNYSLTVTDATGCTGTDIIAVALPAAPSVSITGDTQICPGETTTLSATPGFGYLWSTGANTPTINVNAAGNYAVTVTDAFGCTAFDGISVNALPAPSVSISGPTTICAGNTATFDAGSFPSYLWSTGETTPTITTGAAGNYSVVVTAANGCTSTAAVDLIVANALVPQISALPYACDGQITLDAGAGFTTYAWSNGGGGQTAVADSTGDYVVTVTDATGCTGTDAVSVLIPPAPQVAVSGNTVFCENENTTLEATAGFAQYLWSTGDTAAAITVNAGGTFAVTATDAFGCADTASIAVSAQPLPAPVISGPAAVCEGSIATWSVNGNFAQIAWSNGATGPTINVDTPGIYVVTVTNTTGCVGTDSAQLTVNTNPTPQIMEQAYQCDGQIALDADAGFSAYLWSTGDNTPTTSVDTSGNYSLTVTDANGCSGTAALAVVVPVLPQVSIAGDPGFCQGDSTNLSAGPGFSAYAWSGGSTAPSIVVNSSGIYAVTATDALGCTASASVQVTAFPNPVPVIAGPAAVCPTSTATLSVPGQYASYQWSIPGANGNTLTVPPPVVVEVTVTDNNGCTGTASASVAVSNQLSPDIAAQPYSCDGQITLDAGGGYAAYSWSNGGTAQTISVISSGNYTVTVSDGGGCTGTASIQVDVPAVPKVVVSGPSSFCQGDSVVISATPGFTGYLWSTGDTAADISVNAGNTYGVTATDALGCTASATITVTSLQGPAPVINGPSSLCAGETATFSLSAAYAAYLWSDGSTGETISTDMAGSYAVTVTDAAGCTGTTGLSLTVSPNPVPAISQAPYACDGQVSLSASAGFAAYAWSTGQAAPAISVNISGNYSLTVTNSAGCTGTATIAANVPTLPSVAISGESLICTGETTTLTATPGLNSYAWSGGQNTPGITVGAAGTYSVTATDALGCTATANFSVNIAQPDIVFIQETTCDPLAAGTDTLLLSNVNGCDSLVVTETILAGTLAASAAAVSDFNGFGISCAGANDGAALATPLVGQAPFSFQWSNGATDSSAQGLGAGVYSVTITDASGCSGNASVTLTEPLPVTPILLAENPTCQNAGLITVENVSGGFGPYTVRLAQDSGVTNGQEPLVFDALDAGTFTLEITDANGCTTQETVVLSPPPVLQEFVSDTLEVEKGETVTLSPAITITPVAISWTSSSGQLSCADCLSPSLTPVVPTTVELDVQGFGACTARGLYYIVLADGPQVYIPNAIAPESAENFSFTLYGDDRVVRVRSLQIYDRWGGQMALLRDFAPNDPAQGWDGRWNGQAVQPGVYVYWAEVEFADGSTEVFSGDVTVVR